MAAIDPLLAFGFAESRLRREALSAWETLRTTPRSGRPGGL